MSFEVGDKVFDIRFGKGIVMEIGEDNSDYPVVVHFTNHDIDITDYTLDGKLSASDALPTLYHTYGFTAPSCKEPERKKTEHKFKPFDKVLVRDAGGMPWRASFYSHDESVIFGNTESTTYSVTTSGQWKYCIPYEGNEDKVGKVTE